MLLPQSVANQPARPSQNSMHDLIIIGAGPAGLSMAAEARSAGIAADKLLILEKGEAHSWSIRKFYPETKLVEANYKGKPAVCSGVLCIPDMSKDDTLTYLDQAIEEHQLVVHYKEGVNAITRREDGSFEIRTNKATYESKVCVIAIGILGKPNKPDYKIPVKILTGNNIEGLSEDEGRPRLSFADDSHPNITFDHVVYALGGTTPENFLREVGIEFEGKMPKVTQGYETSIPALYLIGDLTPESGSIILAFNTAHEAIQDICESHLGCSVDDLPTNSSRE